MGVARTADNHLLAANYNHDVANPRSRITSDDHPRRRKLLSHGRVAKSFPGGTVGISGNRRSLSRPGAAEEHGAGFNAREVPKLPSVRRQLFRYPGYPGPSAHTPAAQGPTHPAGFSFAFAGAGCGKL